MPNLGEMLANNIQDEQRKIEEERARKQREADAEAQRRSDIAQRFFDGAAKYFSDGITGKQPVKSLFRQVGGARYNHQEPNHSEFRDILDGYSRNPSKNEPLSLSDPTKFKTHWDAFVNWAASQGLDVYWDEDRDGGNVESWWVLRVRPAQSVT